MVLGHQRQDKRLQTLRQSNDWEKHEERDLRWFTLPRFTP